MMTTYMIGMMMIMMMAMIGDSVMSVNDTCYHLHILAPGP